MMNANNLIDSMFISQFDDDENEDLIQLVTDDDSDDENEILPDELPILPIRNTVLFPGVVIPITVGRKKSSKLVKQAYRKGNRVVGVVAQRDNVCRRTRSGRYLRSRHRGQNRQDAGAARRKYHHHHSGKKTL